MKERHGFVSNSSSSSFICDVCGETFSGWDMGYSEAEMVCCKNGHEFCEMHLTDPKALDQLMDEDREDYDEDWRYETPIEFCPICQLQMVEKHDKIQYLMKMCGMNDDDILRDIQNRFKSYEEFNAFLK